MVNLKWILVIVSQQLKKKEIPAHHRNLNQNTFSRKNNNL